MKVAVRRVNLGSLGKFGCLLGVVAACLPSLLCAVLGLGLVDALRRWLEGWEDINITILGQEIAHLDFVSLLGLAEVLERLRSIAATSGLALALVVLVLALASGLLLAAIVVLVGLAYNAIAAATGGLVVDAALVNGGPSAERAHDE